MEGLSSLVDKNLIQRIDRGMAEPRFAMLQTIREFATEEFETRGRSSPSRRAHAAYCMVIAEEGNPDLNQEKRNEWLSRCDLEMDNFRCALDWLLESGETGVEPAPRRRAFSFLGYAGAPERGTRQAGKPFFASQIRTSPWSGRGWRFLWAPWPVRRRIARPRNDFCRWAWNFMKSSG